MIASIIRSTGIKSPDDVRMIDIELEVIPRLGEYLTILQTMGNEKIEFYGWVNRVEWLITSKGQTVAIYIGANEPAREE